RPLATAMPLSRHFTPAGEGPLEAGTWALSRFAYLHRSAGELALESPTSAARVLLHDPRLAALVGALAAPRRAADFAHLFDFPPEVRRAFFDLLRAFDMLTPVDEHGVSAEEQSPVLRPWAFHDLLFHARAREGRHEGPFGMTWSHAGEIPPLPACKPPMGARF